MSDDRTRDQLVQISAAVSEMMAEVATLREHITTMILQDVELLNRAADAIQDYGGRIRALEAKVEALEAKLAQ